MVFSKSFGYALRGALYIAMANDTSHKIHLDEIAAKLVLPRHFLGKIMKRMVKEGVLNSVKGPYGGFSINERTLDTPLLKLIEITGETEEFDACVLRLRKCNALHPCPLHGQIETIKNQWYELVSTTTIGDLLKKDQPDYILNIATT